MKRLGAISVALTMLLGVAAGVSPAAASAATTGSSVVATPSATLVDTHTGTNAPHRALLGGETVSVYAFGKANVPGDGAAAVRLKVRLDSATGGGTLSIHYADIRDPHPAVLTYAKGRTVDAVVQVALGVSGHIVVENASSARVQVDAVTEGYVPLSTSGNDSWTHSRATDAGSSAANAAAGQSSTSLAHPHALYAPPTVNGAASHLIAGGLVYAFAVREVDNEPQYGVQAYALRTGHLAWALWALGRSEPQQLAVYGSYLYATSRNANSGNVQVTAIGIVSHQALWSHDVTAPSSGYVNGDTESLIVDGGVVVVTTGYVDAFDAATGRHLWVDKVHVPLNQTVAEDAHLALPYDDGIGIVDIRTGRLLWTLIHTDGDAIMAGHRILVYAGSYVWSYSSLGCGKALCYPSWRAQTGVPASGGNTRSSARLSATATLIAVEAVATTESDSNAVVSQVVRYRTFDARTGAVMADRMSSGTGPGFTGEVPVIVGDAVLVNHDRELDSMPAGCRGFCQLHTVLRYTDSYPSTGDLVLAEGVLITGADDNGLTPTAYAVG